MSIRSYTVYILAACLFCAAPAFADTTATDEKGQNWSLDLSSGFFSDYMFRGFNLYDGTVFQPSVAVNYDLDELGSLSAYVWSSVVTESRKKDNNFTEVDYSISYSKQINDLSLTFGHLWYTFPHDKTESLLATQEIFVSLSYDTILTPTLSFFEDYDAFDTQYYELGISHNVECAALGEGFNMTPFAAFGFGTNTSKVYDDDGLEQITTGVSFELALGDIAVTPSLNYSFKIDDNTVNNFWSGVSFQYSY